MPLNQISGAKGHLASRVYGPICLFFSGIAKTNALQVSLTPKKQMAEKSVFLISTGFFRIFKILCSFHVSSARNQTDEADTESSLFLN